MATKDFFSGHSKVYAAFRPTYPDELYDYVLSYVINKTAAWDCGTGNGQVAQVLAKKFVRVIATDISDNQLAQAIQLPNIEYRKMGAEQTDFPDNSFDLVTVGQALHWFDLGKFYTEVQRTMVPGGVLAVWGYALLTVDKEIDNKFLHFYYDVVGAFWDEARKMVEQQYAGIPFPFQEIPTKNFEIKVRWSLDQFAGYLSSWSATQKFIQTNGFDPVPGFIDELRPLWNDGAIKSVSFPVFTKLGRV